MQLTITFPDDEARSILYFLRRRYKSKADLCRLAKVAIRTVVAEQANIELKIEEG